MNENWKRYAAIHKRLDEIDAEQKALKAEALELEPTLLEEMSEDGIDRMTINGVTFYPRRRVFVSAAKGCDKEQVSDALIACGLGDFVSRTFNTNTLSAYVREVARNHSELEDINEFTCEEIRNFLPDELRDKVFVGEQWQISARKG